MNNGCDLVTLPPFSKQVLASLTKKKLRKENTILKAITFSWPKWICLWCCPVLWSFWSQTAEECSFLICCGMLTNTLPVLLVLKSRLFIWDLYSSVSPLCLICKSGEHAFSTLLQIISAPYWILRRLRYGDPVKPRNCFLSWHTWFPPISPVLEETAHFLFWMHSSFLECVCWSHPRPQLAQPVPHYLHCHGERGDGESIGVCLRNGYMDIFLILWFCSISEFCFNFTENKTTVTKQREDLEGCGRILGSPHLSRPTDLQGQINL